MSINIQRHFHIVDCWNWLIGVITPYAYWKIYACYISHIIANRTKNNDYIFKRCLSSRRFYYKKIFLGRYVVTTLCNWNCIFTQVKLKFIGVQHKCNTLVVWYIYIFICTYIYLVIYIWTFMAYLLKRNTFCCIFKQHLQLCTKVIKVQENAI